MVLTMGYGAMGALGLQLGTQVGFRLVCQYRPCSLFCPGYSTEHIFPFAHNKRHQSPIIKNTTIGAGASREFKNQSIDAELRHSLPYILHIYTTHF